uniref:Thiol:disulfide interchange protein n=1 Tax=Caloglossa monosticha TaxID=76906 RepID=A0A1Z1M4Y7_9FLOR|nr:thiol:disulfide interchange protein [Caloglossa monosticha]ARW60970.1 thiol:disulfide interchange protein [Caloglossa monosticha]
MLSQFSFLYYFEIFVYNLQHKIAFLLVEKVNSFQLNIFLVFFLAGIVTILNPCFISIIPLSISYISSYREKIYKVTFVLGLVTSIFVVISITNFFSYNYFLYFTGIPLLSLIILIILSLNLLQIFNFPYYLKIFNINTSWIFSKSIIAQCYFIGFVVGFTTVPCSSPIFTIIHFWLYSSYKIFFLVIYLIAYFLGCVLPLLLIFYIFINYFQVYAIAAISNIITPLMGFLTLFFSLFFLLEKVIL